MIEVEKIIPGGQALAYHPDGRKLFLWNALPGEIIDRYKIKRQRSSYVEAVATKIEHPSKHRVEPKDDCYLANSPWQIFDYDYELSEKQALIQEFYREHKIDVPIPPIMTDGKDYFYRNKMEYALYWDNDLSKIKLALHARSSHNKIPIDHSSLERPEILAAAQKLIKKLNSHHAAARRFQSLLLRCDQAGHVSGGLFEKHQPHPYFEPLSDQILGETYRYSPNGFFQVNIPVYEMALKDIKKHIKTDKVLDLYSGVGTIGLSVARDRNLTLVESEIFTYRELLVNLPSDPSNPLPNFIDSLKLPPYRIPNLPHEVEVDTASGHLKACLAKSELVLDFITPDSTVIVDPPRAGCHPNLIRRLVDVHPPMIIYLSCNPATQARDLETLLKYYHLDDMISYNFFPRTPHIENLAILSAK